MATDNQRWTLENLIDFEQAAAIRGSTPAAVAAAVSEASRGLDGAGARRAGLRVWLEHSRQGGAGRKFTAALSVVGAGLAVLAFLAGSSAVLGSLDRSRGGVNVTLFLAIFIGGQWLVLLAARATR